MGMRQDERGNGRGASVVDGVGGGGPPTGRPCLGPASASSASPPLLPPSLPLATAGGAGNGEGGREGGMVGRNVFLPSAAHRAVTLAPFLAEPGVVDKESGASPGEGIVVGQHAWRPQQVFLREGDGTALQGEMSGGVEESIGNGSGAVSPSSSVGATASRGPSRNNSDVNIWAMTNASGGALGTGGGRGEEGKEDGAMRTLAAHPSDDSFLFFGRGHGGLDAGGQIWAGDGTRTKEEKAHMPPGWGGGTGLEATGLARVGLTSSFSSSSSSSFLHAHPLQAASHSSSSDSLSSNCSGSGGGGGGLYGQQPSMGLPLSPAASPIASPPTALSAVGATGTAGLSHGGGGRCAVLQILTNNHFVPTQAWPLEPLRDAGYVTVVAEELRAVGGTTTVSKLRGLLKHKLGSKETIKSVPLKAFLQAYSSVFALHRNHVSLQ